MMNRIDIRSIFHDHFKTLKNDPPNSAKLRILFLFFGVPIPVALALVHLHGTLPNNLVSVISTSLSVSVALLLNLFVLTYNTILNSEPPPKDPQTPKSIRTSSPRKDLALQIISNIAFTITIALAIITVTLYFGIAKDSIHILYAKILTVTIYYFSTAFALHMLMLLRRLYVLLKGELYRLDR